MRLDAEGTENFIRGLDVAKRQSGGHVGAGDLSNSSQFTLERAPERRHVIEGEDRAGDQHGDGRSDHDDRSQLSAEGEIAQGMHISFFQWRERHAQFLPMPRVSN